MKKVLFFATFNGFSQRLGTTLEYLQVELEKGSDCTLIKCDSSFNNCGQNLYGKKSICYVCKTNYKNSRRFIDGQFKELDIKDVLIPSTGFEFDFPEKIDLSIRNQKYKGFEWGNSVLSHYFTETGDVYLESIHLHREKVFELATNAIQLYESLKVLFASSKYDSLYLFNGRWDYYRAAMTAAKESGIEVVVLELFRPGGYLLELKNKMPHDRETIAQCIHDQWSFSLDSYSKKTEIGETYFNNKRSGLEINDRAYSKYQEKGKLPEGLKKRVITYFISSDEEFATVNYKNTIFKDQNDSIVYLSNYFESNQNHDDALLIIRMHPRQVFLDYKYLKQLRDLKGKLKNTLIIEPEENIDSYALIDASDVILTYGSTIGIEATFQGKPSVLLADGFFDFLNIAYKPNSIEQLLEMLNGDLSPKDKLDAIKFGYYISKGGVKSKYFENKSLTEHYFKGEPIYQFTLKQRVVNKLLKFFE